MSTGELLRSVISHVDNGLILSFVTGLSLCIASFFTDSTDDIFFSFGVILICAWPGLFSVMVFIVILVFIKEVFVEMLYLCWCNTIGRMFARQRTLETTPLITPQSLAESGYSQQIQPNHEYLAVDIEAVDLESIRNGALVRLLPTRLVRLPVDDISQIAVLSWRWDFARDAFQDPSQNIAVAIKHARLSGVRYLFIDIISLDQSLEVDILLPLVARFGALYTTIPVIAAYDDPRLGFHHIILRPWIFSEIKLMAQNPYNIVYVGHTQQGTYVHLSIFQYFLGRMPKSRIYSTAFANELKAVWASNYSTTAIEILNGNVQMTNIHDFKFIYPAMKDIFIAAEKLDRNDYLLTVALMTCASRENHIDELVAIGSFAKLKYNKYKIYSRIRQEEWESEDRDDSGYTRYFIEHTERHRFYLGGVRVASFWYYSEKWRESHVPRYKITLAANMERHTFQQLGLDSAAYIRYTLHQSQRQGTLGVRQNLANPRIRVVEG